MTQEEICLTAGAVQPPGFTMDYFAFGQGKKPLVIIPGMGVRSIVLSQAAVADAYAGFAEEYRVFLFDYRRELPDGFTVREMAGDLAAVLRKLNIRGAAIVGISLGGMIAQYLAIDAPELVGKLVLGSTLTRHTEKSRRVFAEWARLARAENRTGLQRAITRRVYSPAFVQAYRQAFDAQAKAFTPEEMARYARLCEACMGFSAMDELKSIRCPVLVMGCWGDRTLFPEGSLMLAKKLRCDLFMYAGYSHAVYDEAPDYKRRITDFLANG